MDTRDANIRGLQSAWPFPLYGSAVGHAHATLLMALDNMVYEPGHHALYVGTPRTVAAIAPLIG